MQTKTIKLKADRDCETNLDRWKTSRSVYVVENIVEVDHSTSKFGMERKLFVHHVPECLHEFLSIEFVERLDMFFSLAVERWMVDELLENVILDA